MLRGSTRNSGNVATLYLQGKIVIGDTECLRKIVRCHIRASAIVIDLARVTTIDAHGLGVLLELRQEAESSGIEFRLINVTRLVSQVLEITRLDSVFEIARGAQTLSACSFAHFGSAAQMTACA